MLARGWNLAFDTIDVIDVFGVVYVCLRVFVCMWLLLTMFRVYMRTYVIAHSQWTMLPSCSPSSKAARALINTVTSVLLH